MSIDLTEKNFAYDTGGRKKKKKGLIPREENRKTMIWKIKNHH